MHDAKPEKEHEWLQQMVGEWNCEGEAVMAPGQPPVQWKTTESVRSIGGLWVVGEGRGQMPEGGDPTTTLMTLGYDPQRKRFVGTFVGSMMTNLWVYDGALDPAGKVLTLDTEGPSMTGDGATQPYQDVIDIVSADHRTLISRSRGPDGTWQQFMTAHYRRAR